MGFKTAVEVIHYFGFGGRFDFLSIEQYGLWPIGPVQFYHEIPRFTLVSIVVWCLNFYGGIFTCPGDLYFGLGVYVPFIIVGLPIVLVQLKGGAFPARRKDLKDHGRIF